MGITHLFIKNKKKSKTEVVCRYRTEVELDSVKIIFECKNCARTGNLTDRRCLRETIAAIAAEYKVDTLIFSDYVETKYSGAAIEILRQMAKILTDINRFSSRKPWEANKSDTGSSAASKKKKCSNCNRSPFQIFSRLEREGKKSLEDLYNSYNSSISNVRSSKLKGHCQICNETTRGDLFYIQNLLDDLRALILYQAFRVVEDKG